MRRHDARCKLVIFWLKDFLTKEWQFGQLLHCSGVRYISLSLSFFLEFFLTVFLKLLEMTHLFSPTIHGVILIVDRCVEPVTPHWSSRGGILQMPVLLQAPLNQDGQNQHYEEGPSAHGARGGLCSNHNPKKIITKKKNLSC